MDNMSATWLAMSPFANGIDSTSLEAGATAGPTPVSARRIPVGKVGG